MSDDDKNYWVIYGYIDDKKDYVKVTKTFVNKRRIEKAQQTLKELRQEGLISKSDIKSEQSKRRTKKKIFDILRLNLNDTSRFVTLTYKVNEQNYKKATQHFNNMISNFNKKHEKLKYLVVKEHQKRGSIHYHMITFNNEKIKWRNYWKHGNTHIKKITDVEFPEKIANYMVKYLGKNKKGYKSVGVGFRVLGYSNNLIKETKIKIHEHEYDKLTRLTYKKGQLDYVGNYEYICSVVSKKDFDKNVLPF